MAKIQRAQLSKVAEAQQGKVSKPQVSTRRGAATENDNAPGEGLLHKAKRQQAAIEAASAREAAVQAYRQQKQQHAGSATMTSLGRLVTEGEERMKQQQQLLA